MSWASRLSVVSFAKNAERSAMSLRRILSEYWFGLQAHLFPALEEAIGPLAERYQSFVAVLEFVRVERFLPHFIGLPGRPPEDRAALARAFIAKAVFDITTTRALIERLAIDQPLRRLCGWNEVREIPSEATFSRACARSPARCRAVADRAGHGWSGTSRATRRRSQARAPRKGEQRPPKELRRLERQRCRRSRICRAGGTKRNGRSRGSAAAHRRG